VWGVWPGEEARGASKERGHGLWLGASKVAASCHLACAVSFLRYSEG
jgi:hypothetical protein